jgi:NADH-quinone oxidoreductase subunit J
METSVGPVFWILAIAVLASGALVVSLKSIFHCSIALVFCLFSVAGMYILLHAEFLAAAQVLIYVGAVSVLMIFAIMLTTELASKKTAQTNENALIAFLACLLFAFTVIQIMRFSNVWQMAKEAMPSDNISNIGKLLMTKYMLPFEVVSILLLAALIGAIVLAREEES